LIKMPKINGMRVSRKLYEKHRRGVFQEERSAQRQARGLPATRYVSLIPTGSKIKVPEKIVWAETHGQSMKPIIREGEKVALGIYKGQKLPVGSLIRFKTPSTKHGFTLHRITGIGSEGKYLTIGDYSKRVGGMGEIVRPQDITHIGLGVVQKKGKKRRAFR